MICTVVREDKVFPHPHASTGMDGNDRSRTMEDAKELVKAFCEERDWDQFHNPKDLAIGISTEASELLQLFRFKDLSEVDSFLKDPKSSEKVREELADVFYFVVRFSQMTGMDLYSALQDKLVKNGEKYPVETSRGSNRKYND